MQTTEPPGVSSNASTGLSTNQESRIYGGLEADVDKYPFIASLRFDPFGKTFCGGTLVAPQYILTAGHCIKTDKGQLYVSLGSQFSAGAGSGSAEKIKVVEGYRHPLYNNDNHLYDVGWNNGNGSWLGVTEDRKSSLTLQEVNVRVISNAECNKRYRNRITEGMICAGNGNGKDSCNGDSGGPLLANGVVVGIVSWGGKCGTKAGVYTRLTYIMEFVDDVLNGADDNIFAGTSSTTGSTSDAGKPRKSTSKGTSAGEAAFPANPVRGSASGVSAMQSAKILSEIAQSTELPVINAKPRSSNIKADVPTNEVPASGNCVVRRR
ncbi:hypothetical protein L917_18521 [Phytophthora nicotianae]|uniref:Peptidase S1 domain-containing protein n=1 Tax=Phytophthora nicotianae TaxID=4792 RepID=W2K7E4_PHYNI|nr:hypothetical protein L917_18521 [Phytophthora nicotianae]